MLCRLHHRQIHGKVKPTPFHCIRACRQGVSAVSAARPKAEGGDRRKTSTKGRYALRLLRDIAQDQQYGFFSLKEIAERQEVSKKYLEQIIPLLSRAELLQTSRGYQGGYRLCRAPEEYTVYEILSVAEGGLAPVACLDQPENTCPRAPECLTLPVWEGLEKTIRDYLRSITLQSILDGKHI